MNQLDLCPTPNGLGAIVVVVGVVMLTLSSLSLPEMPGEH